MSIDVKAAFAPLILAGFKRRGTVWERSGDWCNLRVRLRRSWERTHFLNVELSRPNLEAGAHRDEVLAAIRHWDLMQAIDHEEVDRVSALVSSYLIPLLDDLQRPGGLLRRHAAREFTAVAVLSAAKEYFSWPDDAPVA